MKGVRRADQQMKPDQVAMPVPDEIADSETGNDDDDVKREKIRREERDEGNWFWK